MRLGAEIEYLAAEREIDGHQQITPSLSVSPSACASGSIRKDSFHEIHWATRAFGSRCK